MAQSARPSSCQRHACNDYLENSIVPTHHFQKSLPRLPIPKLEKTCERYLSAQQPLLASNQFKVTEAVVNQFKDGEGKALQKELLARDKQDGHSCYLSELEVDNYICDRRSVHFRSNVFMSFKPDPTPEHNEQLTRATNLVVSSLRFIRTYRAGLMEPRMYHRHPTRSDTHSFWKFIKVLPESLSTFGANLSGAQPLDLSLYDTLFNSTRIPRPVRDELFFDPSAKHVLVIRNGNYFIFDAFDTDGNILPPGEILAHLQYIVLASRVAEDFPVGMLTTEDRDTWTSLRQHIIQLGNEVPLQLIDSSLFVLVLEHSPTSNRHRSYLHGDGANRWFDKSISLICNTDGSAGLTFEHSHRDGVTVRTFFDAVHKDSTCNHGVDPGTIPDTVDSPNWVRKIEFKLDRFVQESISDAKRKFDESESAIDLQYLDFAEYAKDYLKSQKVNPDGVVQLAIQMASYKQTGQISSSAEMCDMSMYKNARLDWIRPCTMAVKQACEFMVRSPNNSHARDGRAVIVSCSKAHSKLVKEAKAGQAFDRHLSALRALAEKTGDQLPSVYVDPAFSVLNNVELFTSCLNSSALEAMGFHPAYHGGFSITYNLEADRIGLVVTARRGERDARDFVTNMERCLLELRDVLEGKNISG